MTFDEYATKWDRESDNNFAVACFDQNSIDELAEAAENAPDKSDCINWELSSDEYFDAIKTAIFEIENQ